MSKKRVLFYLPTIGRGGIERVVQHIVDNSYEQVDYCICGMVQDDESILNEKSLSGKALLLEAPKMKMSSNRYALYHIYKLRQYITHFQPDIIFSFWHLPNLITGALLNFTSTSQRPKWVMSVHGETPGFNEKNGYSARLLAALLKKYSRLSNERITVSKSLISRCEKYYGQKFQLYRNPAVSEQLAKLAEQKPNHKWLGNENNTILSIGRIDVMKDFPTLINAFEIVKNDVKEAKLIILGDGPKRRELENLIRSKNLENDVDLHGFTTNPYSFLSRCKMFALTSTHGEASPMVLAEAMYFSKPIVCTDFFTAPDFIENGVNGLMAKQSNPVDIAEKIVTLITDAERVEEMIANAKEMVLERHGVSNAVQKYMALINRL